MLKMINVDGKDELNVEMLKVCWMLNILYMWKMLGGENVSFLKWIF